MDLSAPANQSPSRSACAHVQVWALWCGELSEFRAGRWRGLICYLLSSERNTAGSPCQLCFYRGVIRSQMKEMSGVEKGQRDTRRIRKWEKRGRYIENKRYARQDCVLVIEHYAGYRVQAQFLRLLFRCKEADESKHLVSREAVVDVWKTGMRYGIVLELRPLYAPWRYSSAILYALQDAITETVPVRDVLDVLPGTWFFFMNTTILFLVLVIVWVTGIQRFKIWK